MGFTPVSKSFQILLLVVVLIIVDVHSYQYPIMGIHKMTRVGKRGAEAYQPLGAIPCTLRVGKRDHTGYVDALTNRCSIIRRSTRSLSENDIGEGNFIANAYNQGTSTYIPSFENQNLIRTLPCLCSVENLDPPKVAVPFEGEPGSE